MKYQDNKKGKDTRTAYKNPTRKFTHVRMEENCKSVNED